MAKDFSSKQGGYQPNAALAAGAKVDDKVSPTGFADAPLQDSNDANFGEGPGVPANRRVIK
ncbi:MAG TPA: hypothetical protein VFH56_14460 [Acidimicrobiales bacterium]|nr:hypothetical protein [Acidimicrobiales bacterium]